MSLQLVELSTHEAQARYECLPARLRIASLSPAFAAADARRSGRLQCVHVGLAAGAPEWLNSVHLQPLADEPGAFGAISPYGYGGPLTPATDDPAFLADAWAAWQAWCVAHAVLAEFCRFHPHAPGPRAFAGAVTENRRTVSVDLGGADVAAGFNTLTRRKIARARRAGVQARWSRSPADWRQFAEFYRAAMQAMDAGPFYRFGDAYFEALAALACAQLLVCERQGRWLSAGVFLHEGTLMEYHLGANSAEGKDLGTACLMQEEAARHGAAQGADSLYLGGGTDTREDNPLLFYKLGFSRRTLPFCVGEAIHDENRYWSVAARHGFDRQHPPARLLLD